ncbi:MAG: UTRA domain-containing protein [Rhizobiaceae bacterium]
MNELWTIPRNDDWSISDQTRKSWDRKVPYYLRLRDHFAAMIEEGALEPGAKFPPERALAEDFSVTRMTVRQALMRMEAEGLIFREDRRGWFVSPPRVRYDPTANASFTESITDQGRVAGTKVLFKQRIAASQWESTLLGCDIGDPVIVISRLRTVDGRAVLVEKIYVKAERCPTLLDHPLDQSMTGLMAREFGIIERRAQINMRPTALSEEPARALGIAVGTSGLYLSRTILDQFNEVVEHDEEFWRHDAIDICISAARKIDENALV